MDNNSFSKMDFRFVLINRSIIILNTVSAVSSVF